MNKLIISILLALFPALVLADNGSLNFAPPATDYSVIFLGNLFGVVDGVLHGTGSQIMGVMFGVFNSAVLALGGIIIMYTLMVSTMNTAHEGQMLGQKWSSIWIPVRSTLGLALLIPKASGYCLMQIFVMWIVVQGIGAADKVWEAALSYLNRGGVIVQAEPSGVSQLMDLVRPDAADITVGAMNILAGQVCMMGLQNQLEAQRQTLLDLKQVNRGACSGTPSSAMKGLCDTAVPDFIGSVNAVAEQNKNKTEKSFTLKMPNLDTPPYSSLNGICGTLAWNAFAPLQDIGAPSEGGSANVGRISISSSELDTAKMSRAIAIQQMYLDLSLIAQVMINNSPGIGQAFDLKPPSQKNFSLVANVQFGVPYTKNGTVCTDYSKNCVVWGIGTGGGSDTGGVLFNGTEFNGALKDYNGIMMPSLNLARQTASGNLMDKSHDFISEATARGWIMAGSYFFDLVKLNGNAVSGSEMTDRDTGLGNSVFNASLLLSPFGENGNCVGTYAILCNWFEQKNTQLKIVQGLINGSVLTSTNGVPNPSPPIQINVKNDPQRPLVSNLQSSTVYGFINNSLMVKPVGQPGLQPMTFANAMKFSVDTTPYKLEKQDFDCGGVTILFFEFCLGQMFGDLFYNLIFLSIYNIFMAAFQQIINQVIMAFLMIPLQGMAGIFKSGVATLSRPGVNPIVALAQMGTEYINFSANLWMMLLSMSVSSALIPVFGLFIFALIALAMPLLLAWIGIMVGIGFTTAYYVPILPYMIFTFGTIAWLISVIEAMVAAPIVALGVTHPEGHDAFGKGEAAIMILMNVFLRPAMMIIGYIAAIALSYVGVWVLNAGFNHAISFMQTGTTPTSTASSAYFQAPSASTGSGSGEGAGIYTEWAGIYAFFFSILTYTTMYLIIVQRAFTLISYLPDKVLRWIGGSPESLGQESSQWGDELKSANKEAGGKTQDAQGQMDKQLGGKAQGMVSGAKDKLSGAGKGKGDVSASGSSTPSPAEIPPE